MHVCPKITLPYLYDSRNVVIVYGYPCARRYPIFPLYKAFYGRAVVATKLTMIDFSLLVYLLFLMYSNTVLVFHRYIYQ